MSFTKLWSAKEITTVFCTITKLSTFFRAQLQEEANHISLQVSSQLQHKTLLFTCGVATVTLQDTRPGTWSDTSRIHKIFMICTVFTHRLHLKM